MSNEYFDGNDIRRLCAAANNFSNKAHWRWKGLPVMVWEFATRKDFEHARMSLQAALDKELLPSSVANMDRLQGENRVDIDCFGITFRLLLKSVL